jgi:hypothetical protein
MGLREPPYGAENFLHRRRLPQYVRRHFKRLVIAGLAHALLQCAADQFDRVIDIERFGQIFECAALK